MHADSSQVYITIFWVKVVSVISSMNLDSPEEPLVSSTTLLASELCLSSLVPAPFVAQLQRICLLASHLPAQFTKQVQIMVRRDGI